MKYNIYGKCLETSPEVGDTVRVISLANVEFEGDNWILLEEDPKVRLGDEFVVSEVTRYTGGFCWLHFRNLSFAHPMIKFEKVMKKKKRIRR